MIGVARSIGWPYSSTAARAATGSLPPTCSHGKPGSQGRATLFDAYVVERLAAG